MTSYLAFLVVSVGQKSAQGHVEQTDHWPERNQLLTYRDVYICMIPCSSLLNVTTHIYAVASLLV